MDMKKYNVPTTDICVINARMSVLQTVSSKTGLQGIDNNTLGAYDVIK